MKKVLFISIVSAVFGLSILFAATAPKGDVKIKKVGNTKGQAIYNHEKHAKIKGASDCKGCHEAVKSKDGAHKLCTPCHRNEKAGPTKCNDCHK
jgi:hypothetical protein